MNSYGGHLQMVHATTEKAVVDRVMSYVHIQDMARRSIHCNGAGRWRGRPRPVNVEAARAYCAPPPPPLYEALCMGISHKQVYQRGVPRQLAPYRYFVILRITLV